MEILRSPDGCNWDRNQTHQSLLPYLIEETYEVVEAIESKRYSDLKEELGDLLCQIVFHAQLAHERSDFDINDTIDHLVTKLVRRHPHVFGERKDLDPQQVRDLWEKAKIASGEKDSVLSGLPRSMPALTMAYRMGEKAGGYGFDWSRPEEVVDKIQEEIEELKHELKSGAETAREQVENEIGDLLFATASLARKLHIDPESALKRALDKFHRRFEAMVKEVERRGGRGDDYTVDQKGEIWQELKRRS